jgi:hypothetical protein
MLEWEIDNLLSGKVQDITLMPLVMLQVTSPMLTKILISVILMEFGLTYTSLTVSNSEEQLLSQNMLMLNHKDSNLMSFTQELHI